MKRLAILIPALLLALPSLLRAEDTAPLSPDEVPTLQAEARRLHDEADTTRKTAEAEHTKAQKECWNKFLVSKCQDDARLSLRRDKAKALALESRAHTIERELKRREIAEKDAKRAEEDAARNAPAKP
jgi:colicin import membrane protein